MGTWERAVIVQPGVGTFLGSVSLPVARAHVTCRRANGIELTAAYALLNGSPPCSCSSPSPPSPPPPPQARAPSLAATRSRHVNGRWNTKRVRGTVLVSFARLHLPRPRTAWGARAGGQTKLRFARRSTPSLDAPIGFVLLLGACVCHRGGQRGRRHRPRAAQLGLRQGRQRRRRRQARSKKTGTTAVAAKPGVAIPSKSSCLFPKFRTFDGEVRIFSKFPFGCDRCK